MLPKDHGTWTMFLQRQIIVFEEVWYDVHVGRPMEVPAGSPEYLVKVAAGVSRKRIDVVAMSDHGLYLIEVKPHANMEAIGQVVTYERLFREEFNVTVSLQALIVAQTSDGDILGTAQKMEVLILPMLGVII